MAQYTLVHCPHKTCRQGNSYTLKIHSHSGWRNEILRLGCESGAVKLQIELCLLGIFAEIKVLDGGWPESLPHWLPQLLSVACWNIHLCQLFVTQYYKTYDQLNSVS